MERIELNPTKYKPFDIVYGIVGDSVKALEVATIQYGVKVETTGVGHIEYETYAVNELDDTGEVVDQHSIDGSKLYRTPQDIIAKFVKDPKTKSKNGKTS